MAKCELCGEPMPPGEEMFKYHGYSGPCPAPAALSNVPLLPDSAEAIARVAHEANRAWCVTLGDNSQPAWDDAPDWQRQSAIDGVQFLAGHPMANPIDSHQRWMAHKVADGWVFGDVKDPEAKTHPCIRPYHELPEAQRRKDWLFASVVRALLKEIS